MSERCTMSVFAVGISMPDSIMFVESKTSAAPSPKSVIV